jgi:lysozyme
MDQPFPLSTTVDLARVARLVRPFEILEPCAVRRPGGGWSIGYGHLRSAREGARVTQDEAEALLLYDLGQVASVVQSAIYAPIHRNQLEALIAFAFHIGTDSFLTSTTLHRFNEGDSLGAAQEIERWCRADLWGEAQVVDALVRRRAAEKAHFLTPPQGFPKASRARLRPQFEACDVAAGGDAAPSAAPSATMAAAQNISARLRALVPDLEDEAEAPLSTFEPAAEPEPAAPEPATKAANDAVPVETFADTVVQPAAEPPASAPEPPPVVAAAPPVLLEDVAESESEIPPPPMPFEVAPPAPAPKVETPEPDMSKLEISEPERPYTAAPYPTAQSASPDPVLGDVWPSSSPTQASVSDLFARGRLEFTGSDDAPTDAASPIASLFRAKPESRAQIPPRPEETAQTPSSRARWEAVPKAWLWACLALGLAIFLWVIWSIFATTPGVLNFVAGLMGIAVMAVPAYLLLGAKPTAVN